MCYILFHKLHWRFAVHLKQMTESVAAEIFKNQSLWTLKFVLNPQIIFFRGLVQLTFQNELADFS